MHFSTASSGPALVGVIRKDWASQNSIALSWSQVEQPPSDIVDYEVKYYERVKCFIMQHKALFGRCPYSPFMHHMCYLLSGCITVILALKCTTSGYTDREQSLLTRQCALTYRLPTVLNHPQCIAISAVFSIFSDR